MPANWYLPSSETAQLIVGIPKGEIVAFTVPQGAEAGDIIGPTTDPLSISVKNAGTLDGTINVKIKDIAGAELWTGSVSIAIGASTWVYPVLNYSMPANDLTLIAEAYHDSVLDSTLEKIIILIIVVSTNMTLTLAPAAVQPGTVYHYKGKLTRIDTGAGLPGMNIIARREGADVGTGTTGADGSYDITATAPITVGGFTCVAMFLEVEPFAASAAQASLGVDMAGIEPILIAAGAATLGVALVMIGISK